MNKHYLQSKMKSSGTAYLCWFFFGVHYAYLGQWGLQVLYWLTAGGCGIWTVVDLFLIPSKVDKYNMLIASQIADIERREKAEEFERQLMITRASENKDNRNE